MESQGCFLFLFSFFFETWRALWGMIMIYGVSPRVLVCCLMDYCLSLHNSAETSEERQASTPLSWIFTLLFCEALNAFSFSPLTVTHPQQAAKISRAVGNLRLARDRWQIVSHWMRRIKESKKSNKKNVHSPKRNDLPLRYCVF